jgi:hypothetical protein
MLHFGAELLKKKGEKIKTGLVRDYDPIDPD